MNSTVASKNSLCNVNKGKKLYANPMDGSHKFNEWKNKQERDHKVLYKINNKNCKIIFCFPHFYVANTKSEFDNKFQCSITAKLCKIL